MEFEKHLIVMLTYNNYMAKISRHKVLNFAFKIGQALYFAAKIRNILHFNMISIVTLYGMTVYTLPFSMLSPLIYWSKWCFSFLTENL